MNIDIGMSLATGMEVDLDVVEFNGKYVLEAQFVCLDMELRARDLKIAHVDKWNDYNEELDFIDEHNDFRSVRIYHLADTEKIKLKAGERVRGIIDSFYLAGQKTKDGRRKIHITVSHVKRMYHWIRNREADPLALVICLCCGANKLKEKIIPLISKKGIKTESGRVYPIIANILPKGSILCALPDHRRSSMTTGDYRLVERQKGRTMQDIDKDFLRVPSHDRIVPTRERKQRTRYVY